MNAREAINRITTMPLQIQATHLSEWVEILDTLQHAVAWGEEGPRLNRGEVCAECFCAPCIPDCEWAKLFGHAAEGP